MAASPSPPAWPYAWAMALLVFAWCLKVADADLIPSEGEALVELKRALVDASNELYEWGAASNLDHCSWRGVTCDNISFAVTALNLSSLGISGEMSPFIGKLQSLQSIDFSHNSITGMIPDEIGGCAGLQFLDVSFNSISGEIPFSISRLKQLEHLILKGNQISGPIPSTLSQVPNLKVLDLAQNNLSGEIPSLIYWSEVLQYLGLRNNYLSGQLSPDMCRLTGLWYFDVRSNNISGSIPNSIGNCTSFEILDLAFNQLSGEIPFNIGFLQIATLSLQGNQLTGTIPDVIGLMQALAVLDLSYNQLHGPIPPILGNLTYTGKLYLHGNRLSGAIPPELGNMSKLSYLQLNDNELSGMIPAELGKLQSLFELTLSNNFLEGPIPENLSSCISLNYLNVHGNQLNGTIPNEFQRVVSLTYLNLSSNRVQGSIPQELGHIRNLDTLDLSHNLIGGFIPSSLGDLEHLLILDLSSNQISGIIPAEFGELRIISKLDISNNALVGRIPQEIGQLENLVTLDLHNNKLSGEIPPEIVNCFSMSALNLSYNNFTGDIPVSKNFSRFSAESYIGNRLLCGNLIGLLCNVQTKASTGARSKKMILGLAIGGVITIAALSVWAWKSSRQPKEFIKAYDKPFQGSPRMVILHMDLAMHSYDDIMRLTENLSDKYAIGYGASSTVYRCILKSGKPVAIKKLHNHYQENTREFETELETVGRIKHRNLVSLQGYSLSHQGNLLLYDYMVNGSLWDLLHGSSKLKLDWEFRLKIALGAAQGLAYLHHDCDPRIVHRDVKTSNILLDENFEAHLSDFGIARSISSAKAHTSTYVMGTIGYIDPEYARTSRLNEKSDVYSFGIVLLELITGRKAVDEEINLHQWVLLKNDSGTLTEILDPEVKSTCIDLASVTKALQLALLCSKKQPSARPTMHDIVRVLLSLFPATVPKATLQGRVGSNYRRYLDDYADSKHREELTGSSSTSGGHLFVKFGEVISQNTV
ncbi:hypothetical protein GOP47_0006894 [Adiantum capillus-veneris]|uniref:non-specific serine/threonine protein kinase n=1 Tax=Adiantum capillus-veneris TaxID=13818 RepID=A0A9D4V344_ADICA|nr:hypothetical protein GOP47_0006570 [Adiantum capillus-veneris]KAI5079223.1 hypothetical protein GOP47_0006894 [Adiantum capillus-veneris]